MARFRSRTIGILLVFSMIWGLAPAFSQTASATSGQAPFVPAGFPWQTFNKNMNVTTFVAPDGSRDQLWHFLQSAQQSIYVEIFGVNNPYILDLIHEIHDTKPSLDMKFLIGWSSLGYPGPNKYVANNLTLLGYPVKWTNQFDFAQAHQKFIIIDNKTTVIQAGNWARTSFPETGKIANREWNIAMTNVDVTAYYRSVFDNDWERGRDYDAVTDGTGTALTYGEDGSSYSRPFAAAGVFSGQMNVTPIISNDTSLQGLLYCINNAQATLDIQIPYFTSMGDAGAVDEVVDAIVAAKARGVTVRIITEDVKDFETIAAICVATGIPIVWQDPTWFAELHNKGIIVDGRMVLVSSINYSDESITENREAGVIIQNQDVAQWYQAVYDYDWSIGDCDEMDYLNLYWSPNIPKSTTAIDVTVFAHMLFPSTITQVILGVKIGAGAWTNHTITGNAVNSPMGHLEYFTYQIAAQPDETNITVVAYVEINPGTPAWYKGTEMVIHVRDSLGSIVTTTTTTTTTTADLIGQYGLYIAIAVILLMAVFGGKAATGKKHH